MIDSEGWATAVWKCDSDVRADVRASHNLSYGTGVLLDNAGFANWSFGTDIRSSTVPGSDAPAHMEGTLLLPSGAYIGILPDQDAAETLAQAIVEGIGTK